MRKAWVGLLNNPTLASLAFSLRYYRAVNYFAPPYCLSARNRLCVALSRDTFSVSQLDESLKIGSSSGLGKRVLRNAPLDKGTGSRVSYPRSHDKCLHSFRWTSITTAEVSTS